MNKCIGILGGGQLARMSAYQAYKLGFNVAILEKTRNSPAGQLTHNEFVGWVDDSEILRKFAERSDIITLENEFIDADKLKTIEDWGKEVVPSSGVIGVIQDKLFQKRRFAETGIELPKFVGVDKTTYYSDLSDYLGTPFVLKSRKMGYDGYGNATIRNEREFKENLKKLSLRSAGLLAEEYIDFRKELAVMVLRTRTEVVTYPTVETIQENHICKVVIAPAPIVSWTADDAQEIAIKCVKAIDGYGLFGVELFLTHDDRVLVNEIAPRPHNSGHYTIEACVTSQFENHVRAVLDLPLGDTSMNRKAAVMINLLGKKDGEGIVENYKTALKEADMHLHIYGKERSRKGRKMGHITLLGEDHKELLDRGLKLAERILI